MSSADRSSSDVGIALISLRCSISIGCDERMNMTRTHGISLHGQRAARQSGFESLLQYLVAVSSLLDLQGFNCVRVGRCRHDDEGNNRYRGSQILQTVIESYIRCLVSAYQRRKTQTHVRATR